MPKRPAFRLHGSLRRRGFLARRSTTLWRPGDLLNETVELAACRHRYLHRLALGGPRLLSRSAILGGHPMTEPKRWSCVFCGSTENPSGEHVWSKWVRNLLPDELKAEAFEYVFETSERGEFRRFPLPLFELTVKDVCEPCNVGWMGWLDTRVSEMAAGMLTGRGRMLHAGGQTLLAKWGAVKALIVQRTFPETERIPDEHYRELYELRDENRLPAFVKVYTAKLGWSQGRAEAGFYRLNGVKQLGEPDVTGDWDAIDGYLATFSVLDLVIQVFRTVDGRDAEFIHGQGIGRSVRRIWPPTESFVWPAGPVLTQAGLRAMSGPISP